MKDQLELLRDRLWEAWLDATPGEKASLAARLLSVIEKLNGLPSDEKDILDDLASRRDERRAAAQKRTGSG